LVSDKASVAPAIDALAKDHAPFGRVYSSRRSRRATEFGNIIVQVGNSRLGCAGLESVLPVVIIDSGPAQTGTPE